MARRVATSIAIAAPPEHVWQVLTDFGAYGEWNPFIREVSGDLALGGRLQITIAPLAGRAMRFKPVVTALRPTQLLRWKGRLLMPGIFDGEHQFRMTPSPGGTALEHEERFTGILPAVVGRAAFDGLERDFTLMNEALRQRAEELR